MTSALNTAGVIIAPLEGTSLSQKEKNFLINKKPAGVILFKRNVPPDPLDLVKLCAELKKIDPKMIIAVDHEGGRVQRLAEPFTVLPSAEEQGMMDMNEFVSLHRRVADELLACGINLNFAPVADVPPLQGKGFMGDRVFARDPVEVCDRVKAVVGAYLERGLLCCAKHFPGHGDTDIDSHKLLPVVEKTFEELERRDLLPFKASVFAGVPLVMTAHVLYPDLDPAAPATLSRPILEGLLRKKIGFNGAVVSDDLEMKAISKSLPPHKAALRAVSAGCDMVIFGSDMGEAERAAEELARAALDHEFSDIFKKALSRVQRIKDRISSDLPSKDKLKSVFSI